MTAPAAHTAKSWRRRAYEQLRGGFALIGVALVLYHLLFSVARMTSPSMAPALQGNAISGDWVLTEKITYWFRNPRRWEVVQFHNDEGLLVMKRVGGLPGE